MDKKSIMLFLIIVIVFYYFFNNKKTVKKTIYEEKNKEKNKEKKIVFITGSSSGIGKIFADYFKKKNFVVITHGRSKNENKNENKNESKDKNENNKDNHHITYDLNNDKNIDKIVNFIEKIGKIDIFINNYYDSENKPDVQYQLKTNMLNNILLTNKMINKMKTNGKIIYISSGISGDMQNNNIFINIYSLVKQTME
jgi:short-subunit dehydrogenase